MTSGITFLLLGVFLFKFQPWLVLLLALVFRLLVYFLWTYIIQKRKFEAIAVLPGKWSTWDYAALTFLIAFTLFLLWKGRSNDNHFPYGFIFPIMASIRNPWAKTPAFVLTEHFFYQNAFYIKQRKLDHLHSIELSNFPREFRINFADDYSIKIPKGGCTNGEFCDFVNRLIELGPVDSYIHPEAREFLQKHSSKPLEV